MHALPSLGLALGGGGAKGLAHVLVLEALEEMGLRPAALAGTSIGAVVGALYAAGASAKDIRQGISALVRKEGDSLRQMLFRKDLLRLAELIDPQMGPGGLIKGERFLSLLSERLGVTTFEELSIPLKVVAADFWEREEVVFSSGELLPAVRASMALPWLFTPVIIGSQVLIDGGAVNPVPYDLLQDQCGLTVAVDVMGRREKGAGAPPNLLEAMFNTFQIMERSILRQKLRHRPPDVYLEVEVRDVRVLEFHKAEEIFRQAQPVKERLKRSLGRLLA
jgi:NTE family protein